MMLSPKPMARARTAEKTMNRPSLECLMLPPIIPEYHRS
jgi:hypothetical protein